MTPEQLTAIRERADKAHNAAHGPGALWAFHASAHDVPALLAEVKRLYGKLADANYDMAQSAAEVEKLRAERDDANDANERLNLELADLEKERDQLRAERDRALKVIRLAYQAGDDAWRVCADALHPTNPTRLAPKAVTP